MGKGGNYIFFSGSKSPKSGRRGTPAKHIQELQEQHKKAQRLLRQKWFNALFGKKT